MEISKNLELVCRSCEMWGAGDISGYRSMYAPGAEADAGLLAPENPGTFDGAEQIIAIFESLMSTFEHSELIPGRFAEDGDRLVVEILMRAVPIGATATIDWRTGVAYLFRDGLIVRQAWHLTFEEALTAAGLSTQRTMHL